MALTHLGHPGKLLELDDGTTYAYLYIAATTATMTTFLLLHGFPSSSYDWRIQIQNLTDAGYGVLVPDLLGYGDTDKPVDVESYRWKRMAGHIVEILGHEGLESVVGVGHDHGCNLLSPLHYYHPEKFSSLVFVSVPYSEPGPFDIDTLNIQTKERFGYSLYGYWKFFNESSAASVIEAHHDAATSIFYPTVPELWISDFAPIGAAKEWILSDKVVPFPPWLSAEDAAIHSEILLKGGYTGPLNWYKQIMQHTSAADELTVPDANKYVDTRTLLVLAGKDFVARADLGAENRNGRLRNYEVKVFEEGGHWIPVEQGEKLSKMLLEFVQNGNVTDVL
ncbi:hypothetical protein HYFRA_00005049 [Hymenoscyphus fraxineus]|uniref:AB hydrolase-1 domain-containing protein n=1 Tax=Hymenoscyphus fraxineus TaxID=746836 RepID=A0A9N9KKM3_9HELO|nr:hypothetical protein HYFRA_00005049 [Hymenoscyphus fraxineus]